MTTKPDLAMDPPPRSDATVEAWVSSDARRARRAAMPYAIVFPLGGIIGWLASGEVLTLVVSISFGLFLTALVWNSRQIELRRETVRGQVAIRAKVISVDTRRRGYSADVEWTDDRGAYHCWVVGNAADAIPSVGDTLTLLPSKRQRWVFVALGDELQQGQRFYR